MSTDVDFEERVRQWREVTLAIYLDDPRPETAEIIARMEASVRLLRTERAARAVGAPGEIPPEAGE